MPPPSIAELVGFPKASSDLECRPMRIRYNESTVIEQGSYFRMTFPRVADDMLDCRSIKLRFNMNLYCTDQQVMVDGSDVRSIFNRIRVLSGSNCIFDVSEINLLNQFESLVEVSSSDNKYDRYLTGRESAGARQLYPRNRDYITSIAPKGSLLNCEALLPLSKISDLHVEFWLDTPSRCLYAGTEEAKYTIKNVELLCDYIRSPSLSQWYASNPLSFHVVDYSHRLNMINTSQSLCRFSSSHTSLNKIITILRRQARTIGLQNTDKLTQFVDGSKIVSYNVYVNNHLFYEQAVNSVQESFMHFKKSFPAVAHSEWFDIGFNESKNIICVDLTAAPPAFQHAISSGQKTSNLNSDLVLKIEFVSSPEDAIRADSFLFSDALIYLENNKGDLKIKF